MHFSDTRCHSDNVHHVPLQQRPLLLPGRKNPGSFLTSTKRIIRQPSLLPPQVRRHALFFFIPIEPSLAKLDLAATVLHNSASAAKTTATTSRHQKY
jgi:hypothetical protein